MPDHTLLVYPDPRLRAPCRDVTVFDAALRELSDEMLEIMYRHDGIGLAAPQIGISLNLIVIDIPDEGGAQGKNPRVLCNPVITATAGAQVPTEEGCLSVPDYRATVARPERCTVTARDLQGQPLTLEAAGMLSCCLQHEIDHLHGRLFIDRLSRLKRELVQKKFRRLKEDAERDARRDR